MILTHARLPPEEGSLVIRATKMIMGSPSASQFLTCHFSDDGDNLKYSSQSSYCIEYSDEKQGK